VIDLNHIDGFDWDDDNREKNWLKHRVATSECEELFFNLPAHKWNRAITHSAKPIQGVTCLLSLQSETTKSASFRRGT
jgi:hypothetical protein